jgi:hypothetical protein
MKTMALAALAVAATAATALAAPGVIYSRLGSPAGVVFGTDGKLECKELKAAVSYLNCRTTAGSTVIVNPYDVEKVESEDAPLRPFVR